jgi:NAD(P)-dependent dehydrogenase (short-subunit alcohol dehydrogenase family)
VINISSDAGSYAALRNCGLKAFIKNPSLDKGKGLLKKLLKKLFPFLLKYRKSTNLDKGQKYAYSTSKAALNMLTCCFAYEFETEGIICVALDPGWVKTKMGGSDAPLTVDEAAAAIVKTIKRLTMKQTSRFIYNNGKERAW